MGGDTVTEVTNPQALIIEQEVAMAERPATVDDMAQFWPDRSPAELAAIARDIEAAGFSMTVSTGCPNGLPLGHCGDDPECQYPPCNTT